MFEFEFFTVLDLRLLRSPIIALGIFRILSISAAPKNTSVKR